MKVTGFSFIKNAIIYDYPIVEAINSILPICDEFVVAVGKSDDATLELIQNIHPQKIKIVETVWDESMREGGRVLALETDKAYAAISHDTDWAFYIQGDEVIHEKYLPAIKQAMEKNLHRKEVDGLLFDYLHFYGSYDFVGASSKWYNHEIRVVRKNDTIYSYRDAQGFRKGKDEKLNVVAVDAYVYHYGWVKDPRAMQRKQLNFNKFWHQDDWIETHVAKGEEFQYSENMTELKRFEEDHPKVMEKRIFRLNWKFDVDISMNKKTLKDKLKDLLKKIGIDTEYQNYNLIR